MINFNRLIAALAIVCVMALAPSVMQAQPEGRVSTNAGVDISAMRARPDSIDALVRTLNAQIKISAPRTLTIDDNATWKEQTAWLISVRDRFAAHSKELRGFFGSDGGVSDLTEKMAAMNMQFLALQEATQMESRKFSSVSGVLKTRHDTVKNSISNVR